MEIILKVLILYLGVFIVGFVLSFFLYPIFDCLKMINEASSFRERIKLRIIATMMIAAVIGIFISAISVTYRM